MDTDLDFLQTVSDALRAGAIGVAAGRNVFQHANPTAMVAAIAQVLEGGSVKEAIRLINP